MRLGVQYRTRGSDEVEMDWDQASDADARASACCASIARRCTLARACAS